jgi:hypothetical protein
MKGVSQLPVTTEVAVTGETSVAEHKRKLSVDNEEQSSKKAKVKEDDQPHRYPNFILSDIKRPRTRQYPCIQLPRNRNRRPNPPFLQRCITPLAAHLLTQCGTIIRFEQVLRPDLPGKTVLVEFEREVLFG